MEQENRVKKALMEYRESRRKLDDMRNEELSLLMKTTELLFELLEKTENKNLT